MYPKVSCMRGLGPAHNITGKIEKLRSSGLCPCRGYSDSSTISLYRCCPEQLLLSAILLRFELPPHPQGSQAIRIKFLKVGSKQMCPFFKLMVSNGCCFNSNRSSLVQEQWVASVFVVTAY